MKHRLEEINLRIEQACASVNRSPHEVTLIAVSKTIPVDDIRLAYDLGIRNFGESRLQEALPKIEALPKDISWHFIGKLQSNKAKKAGEMFSVIHTLESDAQLHQLEKLNNPVDCLIEVNIAEEPQKSGILPKDLAAFHKKATQSPQVHLRGLMTIGPANLIGQDARPFFRTMRKLLDEIGGGWLSMGMSADFEVAIQEGSTHVRVGTALFGKRVKKI